MAEPRDPLASDAVLERTPEVRYRLIDRQAVVILQRQGEAVVLNELGSRILELIDGERALGALLEALLEEYDVERRTLESDVGRYLEELLDAGIVRLKS